MIIYRAAPYWKENEVRPWFAWRPVWTQRRGFVWLEWVQARRMSWGDYVYWRQGDNYDVNAIC
jgi:hypothetical protein